MVATASVVYSPTTICRTRIRFDPHVRTSGEPRTPQLLFLMNVQHDCVQLVESIKLSCSSCLLAPELNEVAKLQWLWLTSTLRHGIAYIC